MEEIKNRESTYPNRIKIKIIEQNADSIIADIEAADEPTEPGTAITAKLLNGWQEKITENYNISKNAKDIAESADTKSTNAKLVADAAKEESEAANNTANSANDKSDNAVTTANAADQKAQEALNQVVQMQGSKIFVSGNETPESSVTFTSDPQEQINSNKNAINENKQDIEGKLNQTNNNITTLANNLNTNKADKDNGDQTITANIINANLLNVTTINLL